MAQKEGLKQCTRCLVTTDSWYNIKGRGATCYLCMEIIQQATLDREPIE